MNDQTTTIRRLAIFLIIAFVLANVPQLLYFSNHPYFNKDGMITNGTHLLLSCSMLVPALAMLVARAVTKEGFSLTGRDSMLLGSTLGQKKWLFYVLALTVPWFVRELGAVLEIVIYNGVFAPGLVEKDEVSFLAFAPAIGMMQSVVGSVGALGEELGWRGYMMPKLEKLMGVRLAVVVGGIIWGAWHYVAICNGHGFGLDYKGEPWLGMLVFTVSTVCMNAFLTYLTKKTDSIWPAAFAHAANNSGFAVLTAMVDGKALPEYENTFAIFAMLVPLLIVGILCTFTLRGNKKFKKN